MEEKKVVAPSVPVSVPIRKKFTFADFKSGIIGFAFFLAGGGYLLLHLVFKVL